MSYLNDLSRYNRYEDSNDIINKRTQDCRQHVKRVETVTENCPSDSEGTITKTRTIYGSGKSFNCATTPDHYANWTIDNQCIKYPLCQAQFTTTSKEACPEGRTGEIIKTKTLTSRYFGQYVSAAKCEDYLTKEDVQNLCVARRNEEIEEPKEQTLDIFYFHYIAAHYRKPKNFTDLRNRYEEIMKSYGRDYKYHYNKNWAKTLEEGEIGENEANKIIQHLKADEIVFVRPYWNTPEYSGRKTYISVAIKMHTNPSSFSFWNKYTNEFVKFYATKINNEWQVNFQSNMTDFSEKDFYVQKTLGWIFIYDHIDKYPFNNNGWACHFKDGEYYQYRYGFLNYSLPTGYYDNMLKYNPHLIHKRLGIVNNVNNYSAYKIGGWEIIGEYKRNNINEENYDDFALQLNCLPKP